MIPRKYLEGLIDPLMDKVVEVMSSDRCSDPDCEGGHAHALFTTEQLENVRENVIYILERAEGLEDMALFMTLTDSICQVVAQMPEGLLAKIQENPDMAVPRMEVIKSPADLIRKMTELAQEQAQKGEGTDLKNMAREVEEVNTTNLIQSILDQTNPKE